MSTSATFEAVMRELAALEERRMREANERRGDDHGVNLTHLRALAKRLKTQHELALQLWATADTAARLLATLVCRPKAFAPVELDAMIRDIHSPKLLDWFIVNVVRPGRHAEELRLSWKDGDDLVGRAGWDLTMERVVKSAEGIDLEALLDQIEAEMKPAPPQTVGDESLPRRDRHPSFRASRQSHRDRRAAGRPDRLPRITGLHATVRTDLDRRDGAPARGDAGSMTATRQDAQEQGKGHAVGGRRIPPVWTRQVVVPPSRTGRDCGSDVPAAGTLCRRSSQRRDDESGRAGRDYSAGTIFGLKAISQRWPSGSWKYAA
jgi:3-methyladenine DNA glycosylase AlkD